MNARRLYYNFVDLFQDSLYQRLVGSTTSLRESLLRLPDWRTTTNAPPSVVVFKV